jgi:hypothetical protein
MIAKEDKRTNKKREKGLSEKRLCWNNSGKRGEKYKEKQR